MDGHNYWDASKKYFLTSLLILCSLPWAEGINREGLNFKVNGGFKMYEKEYFDKIVKPKLIEMAINGTLPSDMNELDFNDFENFDPDKKDCICSMPVGFTRVDEQTIRCQVCGEAFKFLKINRAIIRKDILEGYGVPVGLGDPQPYHYDRNPVEYKWIGEKFFVKIKDEWLEAESIDWDFI
jgi:hypothetical protein